MFGDSNPAKRLEVRNKISKKLSGKSKPVGYVSPMKNPDIAKKVSGEKNGMKNPDIARKCAESRKENMSKLMKKYGRKDKINEL